MPQDKINRSVFYPHSVAFDTENPGASNTWVYDRAPEGMLFELVAIQASVDKQSSRYEGVIAMFDGHEFTNWNIYSGVQSFELLTRHEFDLYNNFMSSPLYNWECKEYTIGIRSSSVTNAFKTVIVVWYYIKKATREKLLEYAIKHPIREDTFKRAISGISIEPTET